MGRRTPRRPSDGVSQLPRRAPCPTPIPSGADSTSGNAPDAGPPSVWRAAAVPDAAIGRPPQGARCAIGAPGNAGSLIGPGPPDGARPASGVSGIRRPARPNTGAPGNGPRIGWRRDAARNAAFTTTSRTGGSAPPAPSGHDGATGSGTRKPVLAAWSTDEHLPMANGARPGSVPASDARPGATPIYACAAAGAGPSTAVPVVRPASRQDGRRTRPFTVPGVPSANA